MSEYNNVQVEGESVLFECQRCWSLVRYIEPHDEWHDVIDTMARRAVKGEGAWAMQQPLGGYRG